MMFPRDGRFLMLHQAWLGVCLGSFVSGQFAGMTGIWFVPILNVVFLIFFALLKFSHIEEGTSFIQDKQIKRKIMFQMAAVSFIIAFMTELPYLLKHLNIM